MCLKRSEPLLLDISLDFSNLGRPITRIRDKIEKSLYEYVDKDNEVPFYGWLENLDLEALNDSSIISISQSDHPLNLLNILVGEVGETSSRWGSLSLYLPSDIPLAVQVVQRLICPANNLTRLHLPDADTLGRHTEDNIQFRLFGLCSLEHLEIPDFEELQFLDIHHQSIKSLEFTYLKSWGPTVLSAFTSLQELKFEFGPSEAWETDEFPIPTIILPSLRRLKLFGTVPDLNSVNFQVPVLEMLCISRSYIMNPLNLLKVSALRLRVDFAHAAASITLDQLRSYLRAISLQYQNTIHFHLPMKLKTNALGILKELKANNTLPPPLESVSFEERPENSFEVRSEASGTVHIAAPEID